MSTYSAVELRTLNCNSGPPKRPIRKALFSFNLWRPRPRRWIRPDKSTSNNDRPCKESKHKQGGVANAELQNTTKSIGLLNAQSVSSKSIAIADTISTRQLDMLLLTETWHHATNVLPLRRCPPPGY